MLKYRDAKVFPRGRYPTPHEALKIPNDALKNRHVDDTAQELLKGTVVYLLGSGASALLTLLQVTQPSARLSSRTIRTLASETSSSLFGLEILRRIAVPPFMLPYYFDWKAAWARNIADFPSEEEYRQYARANPFDAVEPETLRALAKQIRA